ncbi:thioredoxin-like [Acipenser oxyrinchus oxyrinchus]|uniref:Thioredoxin n=1 Tax=Acipenser oxyrinchus oxyrinchus TaxID=40147 RepID=A0AAD8GJV9_ACIOX|nr:thioredoxin-like [Acipenser oxyrinchus oxyrinchus]
MSEPCLFYFFCCFFKQAEFEEALKDAGSMLVIVDFTATWCGPCKMISPVFEKLAEEHKDVVFLKVDVDDAQDVAEMCKVNSMPTFQFFKNGQKVDDFSGANKDKLLEMLMKYK